MVNRAMATLVNQFMFGQLGIATAPDTWYVGILTSSIPATSLDGDISGKELDLTGYSRVALANTSDNFTVTSSTSILSYVVNKNDIIFPKIGGSTNGTVAGFFLSDTETGNAYIWGNMTTTRTVYANSAVIIKAGALQFGLSNAGSGGTSVTGLSVDEDGILSGVSAVSATGVMS